MSQRCLQAQWVQGPWPKWAQDTGPTGAQGPRPNLLQSPRPKWAQRLKLKCSQRITPKSAQCPKPKRIQAPKRKLAQSSRPECAQGALSANGSRGPSSNRLNALGPNGPRALRRKWALDLHGCKALGANGATALVIYVGLEP